MPPKRTRQRKRAATEIVNDDENAGTVNKAAATAGGRASSSGETFDPSYVEEELKDLHAQVEERCAKIQKMSDDMQNQLRFTAKTSIFAIPRKIQNMTVAEFIATYGEACFLNGGAGMMEAVPCTAIKGGSNAMGPPANPMAPPPAQTPRGKADAAPLCTPHNGRSGANGVTGTAMRAPRVGETLLSANGSPLGMLPPSSVVLKRTKAGDKAQPEEVFEVTVEGDVLNIKSPSAVNKVESNPIMQQKLLDMQNEIAALLGQAGIQAS